MTTDDWRTFLQNWSDEWLAVDAKSVPAAARKARWLGHAPAAEEEIARAEKRLGYRLPPSYRTFLQVSNGWRQTMSFIARVRPVRKVEWLDVDDPELLDAWGTAAAAEPEPLDGFSPAEYYSYDGSPSFDQSHFRQSLKIADPVDGDSMIYVLNPRAVAEDGEWEAWRHAHWIPGAERFPSFAHLMRAEYASFRAGVRGDLGPESPVGPFDGPYAPARPRVAATRTGSGKPRPRRPTLPELIRQLEDPAPRVRINAATKLARQFTAHHPDAVRPDWVAPLVRVLHSELEADVRSAAALMLGSHGDTDAVPHLARGLADPAVAWACVNALHYLSIDIKDPRIADGLIDFLAKPQPGGPTFTALHVLQGFRDSRVVPLAAQILDRGADSSAPVDMTRMQAAFAIARVSPNPLDLLLPRLAHPDAATRAAAVAGLHEAKDPRAVEPLRPLLRDPDPTVRQQAEMSLRFLGAGPLPDGP